MNSYHNLDSFEKKIMLAVNINVLDPSASYLASLQTDLENYRLPLRGSAKNRLFNLRPSIIVVLILAIAVLIAGPKNVIAAFESLLKFVPGFGVVQDTSTVNVLDEVIQYQQDGVIITIESLVANKNETILRYRVENLPIEENQAYREEMWLKYPNAHNPEKSFRSGRGIIYLVMPDGQLLNAQFPLGGLTQDDYPIWRETLRFPPIDLELEKLRILFIQFPLMSKGIAPENIQLEVNLRPAADGDIFQVMAPEIIETETVNLENTLAPVEEASQVASVLLEINYVVVTENEMIFELFISNEEFPETEVTLIPEAISVMDANGYRLELDYGQHNNLQFHGQNTKVFTVINFDSNANPPPYRLVAEKIMVSTTQDGFEINQPDNFNFGECYPHDFSKTFFNQSKIDVLEVCFYYEPSTETVGTKLPEYSVEFLLNLYNKNEDLFDIVSEMVMLQDIDCVGIKPIFNDYCGGSGGGGGSGESLSQSLDYKLPPRFPLRINIWSNLIVDLNREIVFDLPNVINENLATTPDDAITQATAIPFVAQDFVSDYQEELTQFEEALSKYGNQLLETGWVHQIISHENVLYPGYFHIEETWFNFDEQKRLLGFYSFGTDQDDTLLGKNYYSNGISVQLSLNNNGIGTAREVDFYIDEVPLGFYKDLKDFRERLNNENYSLLIETGNFFGNEVIVYEFISSPEPLFRCPDSVPCDLRRIFYLEMESGKLLGIRSGFFNLATGKPFKELYTWEVTVFEMEMDPPLDILNAIKKVAEEAIASGVEPLYISDGSGGGGGGGP